MAFNNSDIGFGQSGLVGENVSNPTAIDYSKGDQPVLFVTQQDGSVWRFEVARTGFGDPAEYEVTSSSKLEWIQDNTQNYNDDGTVNNTEQRQVTGLVTTVDDDGNDVLYVSSSDWRIAVGTDTGLDTNSGQVHRIVLDKDTGALLSSVALVRGLPRSEENHSTNGLDLSVDEVTSEVTLWIAQGGNTNKGAPGNNFAGTVDFALSGTILKVNLTELESYDVRTDGSGDDYILDLPTLDDPTRGNVDLSGMNIENLGDAPNFTLDDNGTGTNGELNPDWAGGANGLNMAKIADKALVQENGQLKIVDNPLQVHQPGYRNQYDVLVTESGDVYSWDNGPNTNWGGQPLSWQDGNVVDDWQSDLATNEFNETGSNGYGDQLTYGGEVTDAHGPYAGDANPIRASKEVLEAAFNPDGTYKPVNASDPVLDQDGSTVIFANETQARDYLSKILIIYEEVSNGNWQDSGAQIPPDLFDVVSGYDWTHPGDSLSNAANYYDTPSLMDGTAFSPESELLAPGADGSFKTTGASTNGLAEYTATFFGGALKGSVLGAAFNSNIYFQKPVDTDGDGRPDDSEDLGTIDSTPNQPLGLMALGDDGFGSTLIDTNGDGVDDFAGLVIGATYGANAVTFWTPGGTPLDPGDDLDLDGFNDTLDSFVGDPLEGKGVTLNGDDSALWDFELNNPASTPLGANPGGNSLSPSIGINAVLRNGTTLQQSTTGEPALFDLSKWDLGGASTFTSIDGSGDGSAEGGANDQQNVIGVGFQAATNVGSLKIRTETTNIFDDLNNDRTWDGGEKAGLIVGPGNQTTFVQATLAAVDDGGTVKYGLELLVEEDDTNTSVFVEMPGIEADLGLTSAGPAEIEIDVDMTPGSESATARARYVDSGGFTQWFETASVAVPGDVVDALKGQFSNLGKDQGAFVGMLATTGSANSDTIFSQWDNIIVTSEEREFGTGEVLFRWNAGNSDVAATDGGPTWVASTDPVAGGPTNVGTHNIADRVPEGDQFGVPANVPQDLFTQERWDPADGAEMGLAFGDGSLPEGLYAARIFMGNGFGGTSDPGQRVFDVSVEGALFQDDLDLSATLGSQVGGMFEWIGTVSDGTLNIDFNREVENPLVNGVEILALGSGTPEVSVAAASFVETDAANTVPVGLTLSETATDDVTVGWEVRSIPGGATPEVDFTVPGATYNAGAGTYSGTSTILANSSDASVQIEILGDTEDEADELFEVAITSVSDPDIGIGTGTATVTIEDDDTTVPSGAVVYRVNTGTPTDVTALDGGPAWLGDADLTTANNGSGILLSGNTADTFSQVLTDEESEMDLGNLASPVPWELFINERSDNDATDTATLDYAFDVTSGTEYTVTIYYTENWQNIFTSPEERVFDVELEGNVPTAFDDIHPLREAIDVVDGPGTPLPSGSLTDAEKQPYLGVAFARSVTVTAGDDELNLSFIHNDPVSQNPKINAIEIRQADDPAPTSSVLSIAAPDPSSVAEAGDSGVTTLGFAVNFDTPPAEAVTVEYSVDIDGAITTGLTQSLGTSDGVISVDVANDDLANGDETVTVTLTSITQGGTAATLGATSATGTIADDDAAAPNDIDGDGILNTDDPFAYDGTNGDAKVLTAGGEFTQDFDTDTTDPFSPEGGFSGILVNPAFDYPNASGTDPYGDRTNEDKVVISGGTLSVTSDIYDAFPVGGTNVEQNTLADGYQSAADVSGATQFEVHARANSADWLSKATSTGGFEQFGIALGAGGVDDFVKLVISDANTGAQRVQIANNQSLTATGDLNYAFGGTDGPTVDLSLVGDVEFRLIVDRAAGANGQITGQVDFYATSGGALLETFVTPPADILAGSSLIAAMDGANPLTGGDGGLAYGIFVTDFSGGTSNEITANYDFLTLRSLDTPADTAPTSVTLQNVIALPENTDTANPLEVADIVVADDGLSAVTLSLGGADAARFDIAGDKLVLNAGETLDFEAQSSFDVTVTATDDVGSAISAPLGTLVTDINEAPVLSGALGDQTVTAGSTFDVSVVTATDPDAGDTATLTLRAQGGGTAPTGITLANGEISVASDVAQGDYTLEIVAVDDAQAESVSTAAFTLTVEPAAPTTFTTKLQAGDLTILDTDGDSTVRSPDNPENQDTGTGKADGIWINSEDDEYLDLGGDAGDGAQFTYNATEAGAGTLSFRYANGGGSDRPMQVFVNDVPQGIVPFPTTTEWFDWADLETGIDLVAGENVIRFSQTAGAGPNIDFVVLETTVAPAADNPPVFDVAPTTAAVQENTTDVVADFDASDADGQVVGYSLAGDDAAAFAIDAATGELSFDPAPDFEAPTDAGGNNIYDVDVVATAGGVATSTSIAVTVEDLPSISSGNVAEGDTDVALQPSFTFNFDFVNGVGIDELTITSDTVKLIEIATGTEVPSSVNGSGGNDALAITPQEPLDPNTQYEIVVDGVLDLDGRPLEIFSASFTTGEDDGTTNPLDPAFIVNNQATIENVPVTSLEISPDGSMLYAASITGTLYRWDIDSADGTLSNQQTYDGLAGSAVIGIAFDPNNPGDLWLTKNLSVGNQPDFSSEIVRLQVDSGSNFTGNLTTMVTGLPRSTSDHLTNSIEFNAAGEMFVQQGGNSASGAADGVWGNRDERLLSAATLKVDHDAIAAQVDGGAGAYDVTTDVQDADAGATGEQATPAGSRNADGSVPGFYNPFAADALVTIHATGMRNSYDLVWHSNGNLYVANNGTGSQGNVPDDPATAFDESTVNSGSPKPDFLFKSSADGGEYFGHPNPTREEYIHSGGNPTGGADLQEITAYPEGTQPDENFVPAVFDFGNGKSPNGSVEFTSAVFNGALQGALLTTRFSGGDDIFAFEFDSNGDVVNQTALKDTDGNTIKFDNPLDVVTDASGRVYVIQYNRGEPFASSIKLLTPDAPPIATAEIDLGGLTEVATDDRIVFSGVDTVEDGSATADIANQAPVTVNNTGSEDLVVSSIGITGAFALADAGQVNGFTVTPGSSVDVVVDFTAGTKGVFNGELTINSNDADEAAKTVALAGYNQPVLEGGQEPSVGEILEVYGYQTDLGNLASRDGDDAAAGDEVLSAYWESANGGAVTVTQLAAYTGPRDYAIQWFDENPSATGAGDLTINQLFAHAESDSHTLLPDGTENDGPARDPISGSFAPTGPFGFAIEWNGDTDYTDPTFQTQDKGATGNEGLPGGDILMRMFQLRDADGNLVPNKYLLFQDYQAVNFDWNDNVYLVENVAPAGTVADTAPTAQVVVTDPVDANGDLVVTVTFDDDNAIDDATVEVGDLTLAGPGTPSAPAFAYDTSTDTATWTFAAPAGGWADGDYIATLQAESVLDDAGQGVAEAAATTALDFTPAVPGELIAAINVGSNTDYTRSSDGTVFLADPGPTTESGPSEVRDKPELTFEGTEDDTLYQTYRFAENAPTASFTYSFNVPDGTYIVYLYLAETFQTAEGQRSFDVEAEDTLIADDLDLAAAYGPLVGTTGTAGVLQAEVTVADGVLDLSFLDDQIDNALVNGIEVRKAAEPDTVPTAQVLVTTPEDASGDLVVTVTLADDNGIDDASVEAGDLTLSGPSTPGQPIFAYDAANDIATWSYAAPTGGWANGVYTATLAAESVSDDAGQGVAEATATAALDLTPVTPGAVIAAINVGGTSDYTRSDGTVFVADPGPSSEVFASETNTRPDMDFNGTEDDDLYRDYRFSSPDEEIADGDGFTYSIDVPQSDTYDVTLYVAEIFFGQPGDREYDILAEGALIADDLDPVTAFGPVDGGTSGTSTAGTIEFDIEVTDGTLDLQFLDGPVNNALLNGIEVRAQAAQEVGDNFNGTAAPADDWSDDNTAPDDVALVQGVNTLVATGANGDADYVTFQVGAGQQVTSIALADYIGGANAGFLGLQIGDTIPPQAEIEGGQATLDGGTVYNDLQIGDDLLPLLSSTTVEGAGQPTTGLATPLAAGTYTLWFNQNQSLSETTLEITSEAVPDTGTPGAYLPNANGDIVFEVEDARDLPGGLNGWEFQTEHDGAATFDANHEAFTGDGFIEWDGSQFFGSPGNGQLTFDFTPDTTGVYYVNLRSSIELDVAFTEHNDAFTRITDADGNPLTMLDGYKSGSVQEPTFTGEPGTNANNGWHKTYQSGSAYNDWKWSNKNGDNVGIPLGYELTAGETYNFEIAARSNNYAIDRVHLEYIENPPTGTQTTNPVSPDENAPLSPQVATGAEISGRVFADVNDDASDNGEPGLADVTVEILDTNGTVVATTSSAADGSYAFTGLANGTYTVRFPTDLAGDTLVAADSGGDDSVDSDADVATGETPAISVAAGDVVTDVDAGYDSELTLTGAAVLSINEGSNGIEQSNFGNDSFQITNTGDKQVTAIEIDVTDALLPDAVFDPFGLAGDAVGKIFTLDGGSDGGTGLVTPTGGFDEDAIGITYLGSGGTAGFEKIRLEFTDFDPGETISFGVDMDPNSIAGSEKSTLDSGAPLAGAGNWDIGGIGGAELAGSLFNVEYADGGASTGQLQGQGAGQQMGAKGLSTEAGGALAVALNVNGLAAGTEGTYGDGGPSVTVQGPSGETARVVLAKGFIVPFTNEFDESDPYKAQLDAQLQALEASGFPANNFVELQYVDVVLDGTVQNITDQFDFTDVDAFDLSVPDQTNEFGVLEENKLPLGFTASVIDPVTDLSKGPVTSPVHLTFAEGPQADLSITKTVSDTTPAFGDTVSFEVTVTNDGPDPATGVQIANILGNGFSFSSAATAQGSYDQSTGLWDLGPLASGASQTLTIEATVLAGTAPEPDAVVYRVNAGGVEVAAEDGGIPWSADTANANSPFLINAGSNDTFPAPGSLTIDTTGVDAPAAVIGTERWDDTDDAAGEMAWAFDVDAGTDVEVRLYLSEIFTAIPDQDQSADATGDRIFDVEVDGTVPAAFDDLDPYTLAGNAFGTGVMVSHTLTSDGTIDLRFLHDVENTAIKGIEIVELGSGGALDYTSSAEIVASGEADPDSTPGNGVIGEDDDAIVTVTPDATDLNIVTIAATDPDAGEQDDDAQFTVSLEDVATSDTTVTYTVGGTATSGSDYTALAGSVVIPAGQISALIDVSVIDDAEGEGPETVVVTLDSVSGDPNVALGTSVDATATITSDDPLPIEGSALVEVTPGTGLTATTFGGSDKIQITNTSAAGVSIASVSMNFDTGILPDMVWDPTGSGGDATAQNFTAGPTAGAVGLVAPGNPDPAEGVDDSDPFFQPRNGGWDGVTLDFTDFGSGETFSFTSDVDPNSIQGISGAGFSGAVSGYELIGSTVTITFDDGTTQETVIGSLYEDGSLGGAQSVIETATTLPAPTIELLGAGADESTLPGDQQSVPLGETTQTVRVTGPEGATVSLLQMDARLLISSGAAPFDVTADELPFYANEAMSGKALYTATIGAGGFADIPVTLLETATGDAGSDGGLNHFVAVLSDGPYAPDQPVSQTSDTLVVRQADIDPNQAPEITSADSFEFVEGTIDQVFTPTATDPDADPVTFALTGSDSGLFEIDANTGAVGFVDSPVFADGGDNIFQFTLTASDGTLVDEQSISVEVLKDDDGDGVPDNADNAIEVKNPDQRDTDGDNYGNVIDGDFNNDGSINLIDLGVFANAFGATGLLDGVDPEADADFNGNGTVDLFDLGQFADLFGEPLGPSFIDGIV